MSNSKDPVANIFTASGTFVKLENREHVNDYYTPLVAEQAALKVEVDKYKEEDVIKTDTFLKQEIHECNGSYNVPTVKVEELDIKGENLNRPGSLNTYNEANQLESNRSKTTKNQSNCKGKQSFACTSCEYKTTMKRYLTDHRKTHIKENLLTCTLCDYKCRKKSNLLRHMRNHTGEKPFSCAVCQYKTGDNATLNWHLKMHTGEKQFSCSMCDYKCVKKGDLTRHVRIHTGEKPYSCNLCDYSCTGKGRLNRHMRKKHPTEMPLNCAHCDYKCGRKQDLVCHMRIHSGKETFSCASCSYRCFLKTVLKAHQKVHTKEKPFSCAWCDYKCAHKGGLNIHVARIHSKKKLCSRKSGVRSSKVNGVEAEENCAFEENGDNGIEKKGLSGCNLQKSSEQMQKNIKADELDIKEENLWEV